MGSVPAACSARRRDGYERRQPEQTLLYQVVAQHWPSFRARAEQAGGLPEFVVDEFEAYLRCGILEHGLAHLACRRCGSSMVVGFSCKRRGFCPSCLGRRMSDIAAHLVDEVLPEVPVRQSWQSRVRVHKQTQRTSDPRPPPRSTTSRRPGATGGARRSDTRSSALVATERM
ncbi:transposase zinc-binding domain-containing protein [Enhygromyxa salina]|uniref:transposase zinc-binding domain-containing protein n=1 Tax=Enhygromyxa salina TaxID=215803 RepID=UPI000D08FA2C|nr:transposase zinc-binding domain-containing protein [Enhygromyxa salina]